MKNTMECFQIFFYSIENAMDNLHIFCDASLSKIQWAKMECCRQCLCKQCLCRQCLCGQTWIVRIVRRRRLQGPFWMRNMCTFYYFSCIQGREGGRMRLNLTFPSSTQSKHVFFWQTRGKQKQRQLGETISQCKNSGQDWWNYNSPFSSFLTVCPLAQSPPPLISFFDVPLCRCQGLGSYSFCDLLGSTRGVLSSSILD